MTNLFNPSSYPKIEPSVLVAGDRWVWKRTNIGHDNTLYTLTYSARLEGVSGASSVEIELTATASGNDYIIEVPAATTAAFIAGNYKWQAYLTRDSDLERVTLNVGRFNLLPDYNNADIDPRSHVKKVLDALEAMIEGKATKDQLSYSIQGRSLTRMEPEDLTKWLNFYRAEYAREVIEEEMSRGLGSNKTVRIRM